MSLEYHTVEVILPQDTAEGEYYERLNLPEDGRNVTGVTLIETAEDGDLSDFELAIQAERGNNVFDPVPDRFYRLKHNTSDPFWAIRGWIAGNKDSFAKIRVRQTLTSDLRFFLVFTVEEKEAEVYG